MKDSPTKQTIADALGALVGRDLSSVTFVRDYVQLEFDGPPGWMRSRCLLSPLDLRASLWGNPATAIVFASK